VSQDVHNTVNVVRVVTSSRSVNAYWPSAKNYERHSSSSTRPGTCAS